MGSVEGLPTLTFHPPYTGAGLASKDISSRVSCVTQQTAPRNFITAGSWVRQTARRAHGFLRTGISWRKGRPNRKPRLTNDSASTLGKNKNSGSIGGGGTPSSPPLTHMSLASSIFAQTSLGRGDLGTQQIRVMFLISDTGGGHRASAQALAAAFDQLYPGRVQSLIIDFWTEIVGRPFQHFPESYSFLAKNPPLWRAAWNYGRFPITRRLTEEFSNVVGNRNFRDALSQFNPHLIVSVHPLTQFIPLRVLRTMEERPPFVTVCTDLGGAHPTWFHRDVDLCFVPTDRVRRIARRCGLRNAQLRQFGLPVRPAFWRCGLDKQVARASLDLPVDLPVVLVVGGGDGVGGVGRIATTIADRVYDTLGRRGATMVVVCGKNERLKRQLESKNWRIPVIVNGFVDNMSEWMAASDLIVSKAGPGTIAEALIRGLPIVLSGYLPGQEAPNVAFVTQAGVGAFSRHPGTIADIVTEWVSNPVELANRSKRAKDLGRPSATYDIVKEMAKLTALSGCHIDSTAI